MAKYLKLFDTEEEYNSYAESDSLILPNVSFIKGLSKNKARFNPELPYDPSNGCEYVDLGLPSGLKWAKCNVGASSPEEIGLYFAWGEVIGYEGINSGKNFDWTDYKYCNGSYDTLTKYNSFSSYGIVDNKTVLDLEDDAASMNMGGSWHMPSEEQWKELINSSYTTTTWTTINGIKGRLITSKTNGNTLFLPASGSCGWGSVSFVGSRGYCWSSSLEEDTTYYAWGLDFVSSGFVSVGSGARCGGRTVRGVINIIQ